MERGKIDGDESEVARDAQRQRDWEKKGKKERKKTLVEQLKLQKVKNPRVITWRKIRQYPN